MNCAKSININISGTYRWNLKISIHKTVLFTGNEQLSNK